MVFFDKTTFDALDSSWASFFSKEIKEPYFKELEGFLQNEVSSKKTLFPPKSLIFNAFNQTPLSQVKVVIIGQDPYHGYGQAHGLSFSVTQGVKPPPSLKNIFKEIESDLHIKAPAHGCLLNWAHQGVLLLNATLTVQEKQPKSHFGRGWETFTDHVVEELCAQNRPMVFLLWGKSAQDKCHRLIGSCNPNILVLQSTHPSPFSAHYGFLGCRHFSQANEFLENKGLSPVSWALN